MRWRYPGCSGSGVCGLGRAGWSGGRDRGAELALPELPKRSLASRRAADAILSWISCGSDRSNDGAISSLNSA